MPRVLCALALLAAPAAAQAIDSRYTDLDLSRCRLIEAALEPEDGGRLECAGLPGLPVHVWEGDLRFTVAFGAEPESQCAMQQTFPAFNSLGPRVEWRLAGGKPFATILRWQLSKDETGGTESWLVVTRLGGPDTCQVGYVEGSLPDANAVARRLADETARGFDCRRDVPRVEARTAAAMEEVPQVACE